jgi:hypothetical protein
VIPVESGVPLARWRASQRFRRAVPVKHGMVVLLAGTRMSPSSRRTTDRE